MACNRCALLRPLPLKQKNGKMAVAELLGILPDILRYDNHPSLFLRMGTFFQFE